MDAPLVLLASASPRRRRLIEWLGLDLGLMSVDTPEDLSAPLEPGPLAASLATEKALAARAVSGDGSLILAFDTIVVSDGVVLGKPADEADARRMLGSLAGRTHEVVTGVALLPDGATAPDTFATTTRVTMRALDKATTDAWIARGEYLGCAGAYNIEHHLASVADDECFQNVAGLPLCHLYAELASGRAGTIPRGLVVPIRACDAALDRRCLLGPLVCGSKPRV